MSERSDYVSIEIDGQRIDTWTEYRVESDMLTPADSFELTLSLGLGRGASQRREWDRVRELCAPHAEVQLFIGADVTGGSRRRALQLTGRIDRRRSEVSREQGATLIISGRDRAAYLCDSDTPIGLLRGLSANAEFIDVARAAVQPWGIEVISDASASRNLLTGAQGLTPGQRLEVEAAVAQGIPRQFVTRSVIRRAAAEQKPVADVVGVEPSARARARSSSGLTPSDVERQRVREASPRPGESVWTFLERHAERLGIMMWMSPRGQLILGAPNYNADPLYAFIQRFENDAQSPNNCTIHRSESGAGQYSSVMVLGPTHGSDATRARVRVVVTDPSMPFARPHVEQRHDCTTEDLAARAAKRILREGVASADALDVYAPDHGMGRYLYAIDTTASVIDEYSGVDDTRYVTSRTFERSREAGTRTLLHLVPLNSLTL